MILTPQKYGSASFETTSCLEHVKQTWMNGVGKQDIEVMVMSAFEEAKISELMYYISQKMI